MLKTVCVTQRIILGYARDGEWLARETACENVMIGYVFCCYLRNASGRSIIKIRFVGLSSILVPLRSKYTGSSKTLKCETKAPDAGKEFNERKGSHFDW